MNSFVQNVKNLCSGIQELTDKDGQTDTQTEVFESIISTSRGQ